MWWELALLDQSSFGTVSLVVALRALIKGCRGMCQQRKNKKKKDTMKTNQTKGAQTLKEIEDCFQIEEDELIFLFGGIRVEVLYNPPMDGSCFYHAVLFLCKRNCIECCATFDTGLDLRRWLSNEAKSTGNLVSYSKIKDLERWADDDDVHFCAKHLEVQIVVWEGCNEMWVTFGQNDKDESEDAEDCENGEKKSVALRLANTYNSHFVAVCEA